MELKKMSTEELKELLQDQKYCLYGTNGVLNMWLKYNNSADMEQAKKNVLVKSYLDKIDEIEKEIKRRDRA